MTSLLCASLGAGEIVLIIACSALVLGVIVAAIVRRIKGKPSCDCGECCGLCEHCNASKKTNK